MICKNAYHGFPKVVPYKKDVSTMAYNIFLVYHISTTNSKNEPLDNMINDDYDIYLLILDNQEMGVLSKVKQII